VVRSRLCAVKRAEVTRVYILGDEIGHAVPNT
jgi:hypothetical protein